MKQNQSGTSLWEFVAGVDSGSTTTKAILLDPNRKIAAFSILPTGAASRDASRLALDRALDEIGATRSRLAFVVATGYGREIAGEADATVTEITCHGKGIEAALPGTRAAGCAWRRL